MTAISAVIGMVVGAVTVVVWSNLSGGLFELYEIVPGFLFASLSIVFVNLFKLEQNESTLSQYDDVQDSLTASDY